MATRTERDYSEATRWGRRPRPTSPGRPRWSPAGVHAGLLDLGPRGRAERIVARVLLDLGVVTVLYGLWLLYLLAFRGG